MTNENFLQFLESFQGFEFRIGTIFKICFRLARKPLQKNIGLPINNSHSFKIIALLYFSLSELTNANFLKSCNLHYNGYPCTWRRLYFSLITQQFYFKWVKWISIEFHRSNELRILKSILISFFFFFVAQSVQRAENIGFCIFIIINQARLNEFLGYFMSFTDFR